MARVFRSRRDETRSAWWYDVPVPYLRLSSLPLDEATKRHLADELTATVLDVLTSEKPEWTSVHFTPFEPGDFAIAGRLVADGGIVDTHLDISAPGVDEKSWYALRNRLTDVLVEALGIPDSDRWHVNVKLSRYDPHSFAMAGNAADELEELQPAARRGGPWWLRPAALAGFALGAYAGYRWIAERVGTAAEVDVAPPDSTAPDAAPERGTDLSAIDTGAVKEF
jgi:phenylpyruvate tautomerase PptA (4-oxalocrotonate tautomerase family)